MNNPPRILGFLGTNSQSLSETESGATSPTQLPRPIAQLPGKTDGFPGRKARHPPTPGQKKPAQIQVFLYCQQRILEAREDPQNWTPKPLPSRRGKCKGILLSPRHWPAKPNARPPQKSSTPQTCSARDPPRTAPSPNPSPSPGAHPASPASHPPGRGTGTHRARSSGRQGSVGEVRTAQVRDHQERVPRVRGALKERAVLGPSHCGQDRGGGEARAPGTARRQGTRGGDRAPGRLWPRGAESRGTATGQGEPWAA